MDFECNKHCGGLTVFANDEEFHAFVVHLVQTGRMRPSEGLQLYCERHEIPVDTILLFADNKLDYDAHGPAMKAIDEAFNQQDISGCFADLSEIAEVLPKHDRESKQAVRNECEEDPGWLAMKSPQDRQNWDQLLDWLRYCDADGDSVTLRLTPPKNGKRVATFQIEMNRKEKGT